MKAFIVPWLREADPRALAVVRLILFGYAWPGFRFGSKASFAEFEGVSWHPIGIPALLQVPLLSPAGLDIVGVLITFTTGFALLGFGYRLTAPLAAFLKLYASWVVQSSGKVNHGGLLFTLVLFVIAFSHAADAWAVDAFLRRRKGFPRPGPSAEYHWPVHFIALLCVTMYGAAGLTKLGVSGPEWALGDGLRLRFLSHHFTHQPPTRLGVWLADYPLVCRVLASASLCLEFASPLALWNRSVYRTVLPCLALLQLMIWLTLGVRFREMVATFACLLPWGALIARLDALRSTWVARERERLRAAT
ncbi:MAG TPA: HTTM domain-containing protein [Polyangiaceae bacterium]|nr:HTTM domain-containing protein [Polyangiaceae bacterium]